MLMWVYISIENPPYEFLMNNPMKIHELEFRIITPYPKYENPAQVVCALCTT